MEDLKQLKDKLRDEYNIKKEKKAEKKKKKREKSSKAEEINETLI